MKILRNLIWAFVVAGAVAFFAPGVRAIPFSFTTNYDLLNITATIQTNAEMTPKPDVDVYTLRSFTLNNTIFLGLFGSWHGATFPAGSKLVVSWDAGANVDHGKNGDILVLDKTEKIVLDDASETNWSVSGKSFMTVNFYDGSIGAYSANQNNNLPGHDDFTMLSNASCEINDGSGLFLFTTGPSSNISAQNWNKNAAFSTWSDSDRAVTYGAGTNVEFGSIENSTATIKISASGHGPGEGGFFYVHPY